MLLTFDGLDGCIDDGKLVAKHLLFHRSIDRCSFTHTYLILASSLLAFIN
jgi:hypothetical protein